MKSRGALVVGTLLAAVTVGVFVVMGRARSFDA